MEYGVTNSVAPKNAFCKLTSSAGKDVIVKNIHGTEKFSSLFCFIATIELANDTVDTASLIGTNATLELSIDGKEKRFINGIVTKASIGLTSLVKNYPLTQYVLEIRPKLWLLTLNKNFKIYQEKSTLDIIKAVLKDNSIDVSVKAKGGANVRQFCVQYNESDFDFVSRLMEEYGIHYFFQHASGKHTMVLGDSVDSYAKMEGAAKIKFSHSGNIDGAENFITSANLTNSYCSGAYAVNDYEYTTSTTKLMSKVKGKQSKHEVYDFPGNYQKVADGDKLSKVRLEQLEQNTLVFSGDSKVPRLTPGHKFDMSEHPVKTFNKSYVVCEVVHNLDVGDKVTYSNHFTAIEASVPFHPPRTTEKPVIYGSQTAIVTGPKGEEIYTDKFRRIKVQFYWDREGKKDENTSCWIRVAQLWAGNTWGGLYTPRIGQEVVVSFENGDPDRPLVVGCVYNDKHMPPYADKDATKSAIKSASSKEEKGFNELRFEDLKDSEEIYVHAQKDMNIEIINSRTTLISEANDTLTLTKGNRIEMLSSEGDKPSIYQTTIKKGDKKLEITEGNQSQILTKGNKTLELKEGNYEQTLTKGNLTITLNEGNEKVTLKKGDMSITLSKGNMDLTVKGDYKINVDGNLTISAKGKITVDAQKDIAVSSKTGAIKLTATKDIAGSAKGNVKFDATQNLNLSSKMNTKIDAKMNFNVAATMNCTCEGKLKTDIKAGLALGLSGLKVDVKGTAMCGISAPMITAGGGLVQLG